MAEKNKATPKITTRIMNEEDISGVLDIDKKIRGPKRAITYADPVNDYIGGVVGISVVARAGDQVVGVIMGRLVNLFPHGTTGAWIEVLGIDPGWQGHGIGVKLMKAFETHCRKKGAHHINMLTLPHDDILKPFFESQGFTASRFIQLEKNIA